MKNWRPKIALAAVVFLLRPLHVSAQEDEIARQAARLDSALQVYAAATQVREHLSAQADSLAQQVIRAKQGQKSGLLQGRRLESLLQQSQNVAAALAAAQRDEIRRQTELMEFARALRKKLNGMIAAMGRSLLAARARSDEAMTGSLTARLQRAQRLRQRCDRLLADEPEFAAAPLARITIEPTDPPEVKRQKAGFILDQAARLRRMSRQADARIAELQEELALRERMRDFEQDLLMFNPATEAVAAVEGGRTGETGVRVQQTDAAFAESNKLQAEGLPISNTDWPENLTDLQEADLHTWVSRLEERRKRWQAQADSLEARATAIRKSLPPERE